MCFLVLSSGAEAKVSNQVAYIFWAPLYTLISGYVSCEVKKKNDCDEVKILESKILLLHEYQYLMSFHNFKFPLTLVTLSFICKMSVVS